MRIKTKNLQLILWILASSNYVYIQKQGDEFIVNYNDAVISTPEIEASVKAYKETYGEPQFTRSDFERYQPSSESLGPPRSQPVWDESFQGYVGL